MRVDKRVSVLAVGITVLMAVSAFAHVRVSPRESTPGTTERYTMRVPTERQSSTVRTELEVPKAVTIVSIAPASGWKIEEKKDAREFVGKADPSLYRQDEEWALAKAIDAAKAEASAAVAKEDFAAVAHDYLV